MGVSATNIGEYWRCLVSETIEKKPLVTKTDEGSLSLTEAGREAIEPWVTDLDSNVFAFTLESDTLAVAAAMARLSRNSNQLVTILANEFIDKESRDSDLLHRVVTEYGDDSVMQLYPMQMVFEGISNIATKEVEWGRLAAYLEQSTRYLRFDTKDAEGHYAYYTPTEFDPDTFAEYESAMDEIFDTYSDLYKKVYAYIENAPTDEVKDAAWQRSIHAKACDSIRSILPASTRATVGVVGSAQAFHNMIMNMEAHPLPEMNELGRKALEAARGVAPVFFERTDKPDRGGLISAQKVTSREESRALANELMPDAEKDVRTGAYAEIVSVNGTEDDLVAKILVDSSDKSYKYVREVVEGLTDEQKAQVIETYVSERFNRRVKPGRAFELVDYVFEGQIDYGGWRDVQRGRMVDGLKWQDLRTELGHVRPEIIDKAGLTDEYENAFKISAKLHDSLVNRGYVDQAQYATLFGHIMRFSMKSNARSLVHTIELRTTPQGHPAYRKFFQDLYEQIAEIHPNIAKAMKFVGMDEDQELARLGAERAQEAKNLAAKRFAE
jgi:thymidylate synthase ThyX